MESIKQLQSEYGCKGESSPNYPLMVHIFEHFEDMQISSSIKECDAFFCLMNFKVGERLNGDIVNRQLHRNKGTRYVMINMFAALFQEQPDFIFIVAEAMRMAAVNKLQNKKPFKTDEDEDDL